MRCHKMRWKREKDWERIERKNKKEPEAESSQLREGNKLSLSCNESTLLTFQTQNSSTFYYLYTIPLTGRWRKHCSCVSKCILFFSCFMVLYLKWETMSSSHFVDCFTCLSVSLVFLSLWFTLFFCHHPCSVERIVLVHEGKDTFKFEKNIE